MKAKPMNSKKKPSKFNLGSIVPYFRTIYSNDACIECATKKPFYWSILVFLISILLAMIPLTVTASKQNGSIFLGQSNFGFKEAVVETLEDSHFNTVQGDFSSITIKDHKATFEIDSTNEEIDKEFNNEQFYYLGYHESLYNNGNSQNSYKRDLDVYFIKDTYVSKNEAISNISTTMYEYTGEAGGVNYKGAHSAARKTSFIIFASDFFAFSIYPQGETSTQAKVNFTGNYNYFEDIKFSDFLLQNTNDLSGQAKSDKIYDNLKTFCDISYRDNKTQLIWVQSGLSLGVNGGLTLLLGLVVFLMTRGKQNPNRVIKFYQSLLIAFWASFTPSLLALIFGFLMPNMAIMMYVMVFGFRIMWMSMRNLRPQYN